MRDRTGLSSLPMHPLCDIADDQSLLSWQHSELLMRLVYGNSINLHISCSKGYFTPQVPQPYTLEMTSKNSRQDSNFVLAVELPDSLAASPQYHQPD